MFSKHTLLCFKGSKLALHMCCYLSGTNQQQKLLGTDWPSQMLSRVRANQTVARPPSWWQTRYQHSVPPLRQPAFRKWPTVTVVVARVCCRVSVIRRRPTRHYKHSPAYLATNKCQPTATLPFAWNFIFSSFVMLSSPCQLLYVIVNNAIRTSVTPTYRFSVAFSYTRHRRRPSVSVCVRKLSSSGTYT